MISPFTPIFFPSGRSDGIESRQMQIFAPTDNIVIQFFGDEQSVYLFDTATNVGVQLYPKSMNIGETTLYYLNIQGLSNGTYQLLIGDDMSYPFVVTDDPEILEDTLLLQYAMKDNKRTQSAVFMLNGFRQFFEFRIPGGFKDSETTFSVDSEVFETPTGDPCNLYALAKTQKTLTMGTQEGVPLRFAELLNTLLTCTYVYIDGDRYSRVEGSAPEINVQIEGLDSFVFKVNLQRVKHLKPKYVPSSVPSLRLAEGDYRRIDNNTNRII